jgi:hypothetical protein
MHEISMELLGSRSQKAERKREEQNQNTEWPVGGYAYVAKQKRFAAGGAGKSIFPAQTPEVSASSP